MTPDQRNRLLDLLPKMRTMARRAVSQNAYSKAWNQIQVLEEYLRSDASDSDFTAEEAIAIAEKAAEGHDKTGTIRMTMEQVLSGMPPEMTK